jgi:Protein of unknown function (DUF3568)
MALRLASILALVLLAAGALPGCAALAVPALGSAASGGAGALVRAGAASTRSGTVYRTFDASLREVYAAVQTTLARLEFPAPEEQVHEEHVTLHTEAIQREVRVDLQPITSSLTQVAVTAGIAPFRTDLATATTLIDLVAQTLGPGPRARSLQ